MANVYWLGTAASVAQVETGSIDSVDATPANNTFTVTIGGVAVSVAGDTDVNTTATNLRAALNASTHDYFEAITWSGTGGNIVGTADTAGMPFIAALTETGAGTGSVTDFSTTTANAGPYVWGAADNWSGGAAPSASDVVYIDKVGAKILYDIDQNALSLNELHIRQDAVIGLRSEAFATDEAATTYSTEGDEYRDTYLELDCATVKIGEHLGPGAAVGSQRVKLNNGLTTASTTEIFNTASTALESSLPAVRLLFSDADADVFVRYARAGVGIAMDTPGETATVGDVYISDTGSTSRLFFGDGVTFTLLSVIGGVSVINAAASMATINIDGGEVTAEGDQQITTVTQTAGKLIPNNVTSGGICIATITQDGGEVDMHQSSVTRTVTTWNFNKGTRRIDDHVTITNDNRSGRIIESVT